MKKNMKKDRKKLKSLKVDYLYEIKRPLMKDVICITRKVNNRIYAKSLIYGEDWFNTSEIYIIEVKEAKEIGFKDDYPEYYI
jgi:hypothetical protein